MRNKIVKQQLEHCSYADLTHFDSVTNTYFIPKYTKPKYDVGKCYLVKVMREFVNNPTTILATNWNKGTSPMHEYLKVYVSKIVGKMIYVDAIYFDSTLNQDIPGEMWSGYLDVDNLTQLAQL